MSRKQILGNYGTDNNCSRSEMKNWIHYENIDCNHLNYSKLSRPAHSSTFYLKRPKVYATRDFPERCGDLASRFNVKECGGVTDMAAKTFGSMKSEPVNSYSKNYDKEQKTNARYLKVEEEKRAASLSRPIKGKVRASIKSYNANEVANLSFLQHDLFPEAKTKVKETLNMFRVTYNALVEEEKEVGTGKRRFDMEAANRLKKKGKWIHSVKQFGHIPGIAIGDEFRYRAELAVVGLHHQYVSGIDYLGWNGKKFATSIVDSGQYENKAKSVDVLIYSGHGGHVGWGIKVDQKLERGNLALVNSKNEGNPVRVIRKCKMGVSYTYDGLYIVNNFWKDRDDNGKLVFKFELHRVSAQQRLPHQPSTYKECCVVDDVSQGRESMAIRAMNSRDGERPHAFAYTTNMTYQQWCKPSRGCDCTNGCSNSGQCLCVLKNGGEIPYNEKGGILRPKEIVYECGPSCKCPPSCMNRVSQHGLRYRLEIFKTEMGEWGVRSPSYISMGSFVCEYVGKLEPNGRGFRIDARKMGNVGRFIRPSSSSRANLFVQRVVYDHGDVRAPHVMLIASKNIRPSLELTYDYNNQQMDQIGGFQYHLLQH